MRAIKTRFSCTLAINCTTPNPPPPLFSPPLRRSHKHARRRLTKTDCDLQGFFLFFAQKILDLTVTNTYAPVSRAKNRTEMGKQLYFSPFSKRRADGRRGSCLSGRSNPTEAAPPCPPLHPRRRGALREGKKKNFFSLPHPGFAPIRRARES